MLNQIKYKNKYESLHLKRTGGLDKRKIRRGDAKQFPLSLLQSRIPRAYVQIYSKKTDSTKQLISDSIDAVKLFRF